MAAENLDLIWEQHYREIEAHMQAIADKAAACGLELEDLLEMLTLIVKGE